MSEPNPNLFDQLLDAFRQVVREEIAAALERRRPAKLQFTTAEAATMLNVPESWLAAKARAGEVPFGQYGHYRLFSLHDIESIIDNGHMPMVHIGHDGQTASADQAAPRVESSQTGEGNGDDRDNGGQVGEGREANLGTGLSLLKAPARKKGERRKIDVITPNTGRDIRGSVASTASATAGEVDPEAKDVFQTQRGDGL